MKSKEDFIIRSFFSDPYLDDTIVDNMIPHYRTVSCDVAKRPHGLKIIFVMESTCVM